MTNSSDTGRPLVLVTGASSGIGQALAEVIAADAYDLVLVARRKDRLDALAARLPCRTTVAAVDIAAPGGVDDLMARLDGRPVHILINNAGFGAGGPFAKTERERQLAMVDLNIRAVVDLTHRVLPGMLAERSGGILNVASTAAYQPGPRMSVYYASKAFVLSFSEALWEECRHHGVTVTALCPGPTTTEFGEISGMSDLRVFRYATKMTADDVAREGWAAFNAGKRVKITGMQNKLTRAGALLAPHRLLLPIVRRLQSPG